MRLADGVLLVVDAAEGTMVVTEKVVKQALAEGLPSRCCSPRRACACVALRRIRDRFHQGGLGECLPPTLGLNHAPTRGVTSSSFLRPVLLAHGRHTGELGHAACYERVKVHAMPPGSTDDLAGHAAWPPNHAPQRPHRVFVAFQAALPLCAACPGGARAAPRLRNRTS